MATNPAQALGELRRAARDGELDRLCRKSGVELLVAFGSAVAGAGSARDLDLAVQLAPGRGLLGLHDALARYLRVDNIDLLDLGRAGEVARFQALSRGELLYEVEAGRFAELQILAMVQHADTEWMRDLELSALAR